MSRMAALDGAYAEIPDVGEAVGALVATKYAEMWPPSPAPHTPPMPQEGGQGEPKAEPPSMAEGGAVAEEGGEAYIRERLEVLTVPELRAVAAQAGVAPTGCVLLAFVGF